MESPPPKKFKETLLPYYVFYFCREASYWQFLLSYEMELC